MDRQLIVRAQQGDERAFADLTAAIGGRLDRAAYGILRDRDLAEAWSYRLLVHACYAEARRAGPSLASVFDGIPDRDELGSVLDRDQLERAFRRLTLEQRIVLVLRYYLDLAPETVAEALGLPVGTVFSRAHRALDAMRASLEADARSEPVSATLSGGAR